MEILNWIGKNFEEINNTDLFYTYFDSISMYKGIDVYSFYNSQKGIDIILTQNYCVKAIHFFSGKKKGTNKFTSKLPFNLDFSFPRKEIRLTFGEPNLSGGGDFSFLYGITPPWDKYYFDKFNLHLQYSEDEKYIELLTIDS